MKEKEKHLIKLLEKVLCDKYNISSDDEVLVFDTEMTYLIKQLEDIQSSTVTNYTYNKLKERRMTNGKQCYEL